MSDAACGHPSQRDGVDAEESAAEQAFDDTLADNLARRTLPLDPDWLGRVPRPSYSAGLSVRYNFVSLTRASGVVKCQSMVAWAALRRAAQAPAS